MLTNFIYAKSKAMFEERFEEVPEDAVVFIEDTKEIGTHGTYFDCSSLDPNIIPNMQTEISELKMTIDSVATQEDVEVLATNIFSSYSGTAVGTFEE